MVLLQVGRRLPYSGYFRGVIFSWFSCSGGEPRNIYPRKTPRARAQNRRQTARPRNFFHEIAKITTFTKILPHEKYPLYGISSSTTRDQASQGRFPWTTLRLVSSPLPSFSSLFFTTAGLHVPYLPEYRSHRYISRTSKTGSLEII